MTKERLKITGDILEVSTEVACIILGILSKENPDFVNNVIYNSVISSMALGEFTDAERNIAYKDKTFKAGVNEVIKSVIALRELTENIIEANK